MKIEVTSTLNVAAVLKKKGLGPDNGAQKYLAARIAARCDPYVPKDQATLKNTVQIAEDGSALIYAQPYAHYQYEGRAMAGRAPKHYTGKALQYQEGPMRGPHWEERMMADHRQDVEADLAAYLDRGE